MHVEVLYCSDLALHFLQVGEKKYLCDLCRTDGQQTDPQAQALTRLKLIELTDEPHNDFHQPVLCYELVY